MLGRGFLLAASQISNFIMTNTSVTRSNDGQTYAKIEMSEEERAIRPSTYFPGGDSIRNQVSSKIGGQYTLGPVYYKEDGSPCDFQFGLTESGKEGEDPVQTAERGLMEEAGLMFLPKQQFMKKEHVFNTRKGRVRCTLFLVKAAQVRAIESPADCKPYIERFNQPDAKEQTKAHVIIYGTQEEILQLIQSVSLKPVNQLGEYYDKDIKGLSCFRI